MRLKLLLVPLSLLFSSSFLLTAPALALSETPTQLVEGDRFVIDDEAFDKAATLKAVALKGEGKLLTFTQLHGQKNSTEKLDFPPPNPSGVKVPPVELYEKLRKGMIAIGALYEDEDTGEWVLSLSSGFAVAEDFRASGFLAELMAITLLPCCWSGTDLVAIVHRLSSLAAHFHLCGCTGMRIFKPWGGMAKGRSLCCAPCRVMSPAWP